MNVCKCGCGKKVNEGRSWIHGHNGKQAIKARYSSAVAKLTIKPKRSQDKLQPLIDYLADQRDKITTAIELLREIRSR